MLRRTFAKAFGVGVVAAGTPVVLQEVPDEPSHIVDEEEIKASLRLTNVKKGDRIAVLNEYDEIIHDYFSNADLDDLSLEGLVPNQQIRIVVRNPGYIAMDGRYEAREDRRDENGEYCREGLAVHFARIIDHVYL